MCIVCKSRYSKYGKATGKVARCTHCIKCKGDGMVAANISACIICGGKGPLYNVSTKRKGLFCVSCKSEGMTQKAKSRWAYKNCKTCLKVTASYNFLAEAKAVACNACKLPGMVNVRQRRCIVCKTRSAVCSKINNDERLYCLRCLDKTDKRSGNVFRRQRAARARAKGGKENLERPVKRKRNHARKSQLKMPETFESDANIDLT